MSKKKILSIIAAFYCVVMILMLVLIQHYINRKDKKLHKELYDELLTQIGNEGVKADILYSNETVSYKEVDVPSYQKEDKVQDKYSKFFEEKEERRYEEQYGDLERLFEIDTTKSNNDDPETGWCIRFMRNSEDGFDLCFIFPYAIGIKIGNQCDIDIPESINKSIIFYILNKRSPFYNLIKEGSVEEAFNNIRWSMNDYYHLEIDTLVEIFNAHPLFEKKKQNSKSSPIQFDYVSTDSYRVFIALSMKSYKIKHWDGEPEKSRNRLWIIWSIIITTIFVLSEIVLSKMLDNKEIQKKETPYQKLLRLCNPANFVDEYDRNKVDIANDIYKQLLGLSSDNAEVLEKLQIRAVDDLGIKLIDKKTIDSLKFKISPKHFVNPYNAEKVALANELYSILSKDSLTFQEFLDVKKRSEFLFT